MVFPNQDSVLGAVTMLVHSSGGNSLPQFLVILTILFLQTSSLLWTLSVLRFLYTQIFILPFTNWLGLHRQMILVHPNKIVLEVKIVENCWTYPFYSPYYYVTLPILLQVLYTKHFYDVLIQLLYLNSQFKHLLGRSLILLITAFFLIGVHVLFSSSFTNHYY